MPTTTISGSLGTGITLGSSGIGNIVSVTGTGDIYPRSGFQYVYAGATLLERSDTLINAGTVQGSGPGSYRGGHAAVGVYLDAGTVVNTGTLEGGYGFDQGGPHGSFYLGQGGNGVGVAGSGNLTNTGLIQGGDGGNGNSPNGFPEFFGNPVAGEGGIGVVLSGSATIGNSGTIRGGTGGGAAFGATFFPELYANGTGGAGGDGVAMSGGMFTNTGLIQAGTGGADVDPPRTTYFGGGGGVGGFGLALSGGIFTNIGTINGGAGGVANVASSTYLPSYIGSGGAGGAGVYLNGGVLFDAGRISGGAGGSGTYGGKTSNGANGDAVLFGGVAGTLVVESGAAFSGQVVGHSAVADVLELSGTSASALSGIGTEFLNFDHISFAAGAAWAIAGNLAGLASGETISGFGVGDSIILDGYVANSESFVSDTGLELNGGAETLRINPPSDGVFAVTTNGGNSTITAFLETLSTTLTPGITLDTAPFGNVLTITGSGAIYGNAGFFTTGNGVQNAFPGPVPSNDILVNAGKIVGFSGSQFSRYPAGLGVFLPGSGSITNTGTIIGGAGAAGNGDNGHGFPGNPGATGVYLTNGVLTNSGLIKGGNGGIGDGGNYGGAGGNGGVGVYLALGTMTNTGIIQGGNGGAGEGGQYGGANGGNGGAGIYLADATLIDAGTIGGGAGGAGAPFDSSEGGSLAITGSSGVEGDAVQFRGGAGTLVVESGAVFNGLVVADAGVADVLELAGSSATELSGIGTEFLNFDNISFAPGAAWRIEGDEAGLAAGQTIGGFAAGDSIILDGYAATHDSFVPGIGLVLSNGGTTVTLDITGALTTADFAVTGADGQTTITYVPPRIISGGVVSSGETLTLTAGEVGSAIVVDGGTEYVTSGGLAIGTIIKSGGHERFFPAAPKAVPSSAMAAINMSALAASRSAPSSAAAARSG
jgi:hypothetical protein